MSEESRVSPMVRADANHLAMRVGRSILDAAHDFDFAFDDRAFAVVVERLPASPWPASGVEGLSPDADGPWPAAARLRCSWPTGSVVLLMEVSYWRGSGRYRHLVGLKATVVASGRDVLWITLALPLQAAMDESDAVIEASFTPSRKRDDPESHTGLSPGQAAREIIMRANFEFTSDFRVEVCRVKLPEANVLPSPSEAFERLARLTILKLPFFLRDGEGIEGTPPYDIQTVSSTQPVPSDLPPRMDGKRAGFWPLPGGVRHYKSTLDALLTAIAREPVTLESFHDLLREAYEVTGDTARKGYLGVLTALGLCSVKDERIGLTSEGDAYLANRDPLVLFERIHRTFAGILEVLVITSALGRADNERTYPLLRSLLSVTWETMNQVNFRKNWLLSLGLTERSSDGDTLTTLGTKVLETHSAEVDSIRSRLDGIIDEVGSEEDDADDGVVDETSIVAPGLDATRPVARTEPSAWGADRVDLLPGMVAPFAKEMELPASTIARTVAALSAGKHVLFVGPPGTGKTEIAHAIVEAARAEGYCAGAFVATASADWTTFDTIGGYALQRNGELHFRAGALLRAIEQWQWLIIDELNRADVDRAFGELMTVLAGRTTDTAYELDGGRTVRIGPDPTATHPMPRTFRVLATMNTWDKTSLFRLSYAVQRRFAIVHVGVPEDHRFAALIRRHAEQEGFDLALEPTASNALVELFSSRGLIGVRALGPAVVLDLIRYVRRRAIRGQFAVGDAVAEGLGMYVLPQLEGLEQDGGARAYSVMMSALGGWSSSEARRELAERFVDLFPHVKFPGG